MDREAIIHIGTPKTGSTSLQQVLRTRRRDILAQGAMFPRSPGPGSGSIHRFLTYAAEGGKYRPADESWEGVPPEQRLAQFFAEFAAEMAACPAHVDRVIFSHELMSGALQTRAQIDRLRDILAPYFTRFRIVVYLRRQDTLLASQYSQVLRKGMLNDPSTLFSNENNLKVHQYDKLLAAWAEVFGETAIVPRIYERGPQGNFDSAADFLAVCGLSLTMEGEDHRRNSSINTAGQVLLRQIGLILQQRDGPRIANNPDWRAAKRAINRALTGAGWTPTRDEAMAFMVQYAAGNEAVRRRYFPDRASLFSDDFSSLPVERREPSGEEYVQAASLALLEALKLQRRAARKVQNKARRDAARADAGSASAGHQEDAGGDDDDFEDEDQED